MSTVYQSVSALVHETIGVLRSRYGVKVVGSFEQNGFFWVLSFATDKKMVKQNYFAEEIMRGIKPDSVVDALAESFGFI